MTTLWRILWGILSLLATASAFAQAALPMPEHGGAAPEVGNAWTYRYSDGFGKTATYTVQVTAASAGEISDELRFGRSRNPATFFPGLELTDRKVGNFSLREISPYLQSLGPSAPTAEWMNVAILNGGGGPFGTRLGGTEPVQVPAGTFEASKLVIEGIQPISAPQFSGVVMRRHTITVWYAPAAKRFVKITFDASAGGGLSHERETIELMQTNFAMNLAIAPKAALRPAELKRGVAFTQPAQTGIAGTLGKTGMPNGGDNWTYRYSDGFGKTATYKVQVTAASAEEISDELRFGRSRNPATFFPGLELTDRKVGNFSLREISPYLQSLGPSAPTAEWMNVAILNGGGPFGTRLGGTETVQVPAGTFEASKLVIEGIQPVYAPQFSGIVMRRHTITVWYAPAAKRFVKATFTATAGGGLSAEKETIELTEFQLK